MLKSFYSRNLRIYVISQSFCSWQAFPSLSNVCGRGQDPTLEWSTWKVLHSGRLQPYLQTLNQAWKACQGATIYCEIFYNIVPWSHIHNTLLSSNLRMGPIS
jgi:hypothetical protein